MAVTIQALRPQEFVTVTIKATKSSFRPELTLAVTHKFYFAGISIFKGTRKSQ